MVEGRGVLPEPNSHSPLKAHAAPFSGSLPDHACERVPAFTVPVGVVVDGAEVPVAFRPGRLQRDRPLVQRDRFVNAARRAGLLGLATQRIESNACSRAGRRASPRTADVGAS